MAEVLVVPLVVVAFIVLLLLGRSLIAKGLNTSVANGSVVLVLATVVGVLALGMVLSLDGW